MCFGVMIHSVSEDRRRRSSQGRGELAAKPNPTLSLQRHRHLPTGVQHDRVSGARLGNTVSRFRSVLFALFETAPYLRSKNLACSGLRLHRGQQPLLVQGRLSHHRHATFSLKGTSCPDVATHVSPMFSCYTHRDALVQRRLSAQILI
jgi:hypothetical protein